MNKVLIVDGYNIIGAWDNLQDLKRMDLGASREQLTAILSAFHPWCWNRIMVVFDGKEAGAGIYDGVEVVFSREHETADTLIERLVKVLVKDHRVTVATSDAEQRRTVSALGAGCLSAPALLDYLKERRDGLLQSTGRESQAGRSTTLHRLLGEADLETMEKWRRRKGPGGKKA